MGTTNGATGNGGGLSEEEARELRRIRRLLKQIGDIAREASLTGALSEGAPDGIERYNLIVRHLEERGIITGPFFPPLPMDAGFDRVGVACKLLYSYLEEEIGEEDKRRGEGGPSHKFVINSPGNIPDLEQLRDLGRLIRENLPEFLRDKERREADAAAARADQDAMPFPSGDLGTAPTVEQQEQQRRS